MTAESDLVLVDTCMWAAFFSKAGCREKQEIDGLIDDDRVALVGPVVAEVLLGFRRKEQADWVASRLRLAHYFEPAWNDWRDAAELGRELASHGQEVPLTDLMIAALARRTNAWIYTSDPHFDLISGLKRHR